MVFRKLKSAGLPRASAKFTKLAAAKKLTVPSIKKPKIVANKVTKPIKIGKYLKTQKLPSPKKIAILKKALKKNA